MLLFPHEISQFINHKMFAWVTYLYLRNVDNNIHFIIAK